MICKHCGDEADDDSCTAMALRENAELRRRVRLARRALSGVSQHGTNYSLRGPEAIAALDLRKPLPKRGRR